MSRLIEHRPSPAMVVALLALVIAMGGTSYAAIKLPANSVGTQQIKANAVVASKIKDGTLSAKDFAPGQMPKGIPGPQGASGGQGLQGPQGGPGPQGPEGPPAVTTIDTVNNGPAGLSPAVVMCPPGEIATGGGGTTTGMLTESRPVLNNGFPVGWQAASTGTVTAWAVCVG